MKGAGLWPPVLGAFVSDIWGVNCECEQQHLNRVLNVAWDRRCRSELDLVRGYPENSRLSPAESTLSPERQNASPEDSIHKS